MKANIIIPIYNEQENLPTLFRRLKKTCNGLEDITWQVIYINDGSEDESLRIMLEQSKEDSRFSVLDLSRNFGHQAAIAAGLAYTDGDIVIFMDGDLQDPPEVIHRTVAEFMDVGALKPRTIMPRNLRLGTYRGGRRPLDIYRRVFSGIYGSPMPAQGAAEGIAGDEVADDAAGGSISRQEIWDVVNYVLSLPYEPLSRRPEEIEGYDYTVR